MKLSIIICVYNTERTLFAASLKSIAESTLMPEDYEILVIDDGSDIDYADIIEQYGARCIRTENRGIFRARLLGIAEAKGEYIAFADSDDSVTFNYHRPMLECLEGGYDIVLNDWAFHTERSMYCCMNDSTVSGDISYEGEECLAAFLKNEGREHSYFVLWNKMFQRELLRSAMPILMPIAEGEKKYNYSEDTLIAFFAFLGAKRVKNIHTGYYLYRIHEGQTVNVTSEEKLASQIMNMSSSLNTMEAYVREKENADALIKHINKWRELMSRTHYSHAKANNYRHLYNLIQERYRVKQLEISKFRDSRPYSRNILLPKNLCEIDAFLLSLFKGTDPITVSVKGTTNYVKKSIKYISDRRSGIIISDDGVSVPKPIILLKNRIIMNRTVYSIGLILFRKGSKMRAFLKKHL